jgi:hypothetical protein
MTTQKNITKPITKVLFKDYIKEILKPNTKVLFNDYEKEYNKTKYLSFKYINKDIL